MKQQNLRNFGKHWFFATAILVFIASGCGSAGSTDSGSAPVDSGEVHGTVVGSNGDQSSLANWVVALIGHDSGIARVGTLDSAGLFHLTKVNMDETCTLVLLTPDYKFTAVLALSSPTPGFIRTFLKPQTYLPKLVHRSQIMTFFAEDGLAIGTDIAVDSDGDLIPEGLDPDQLGLREAKGMKLQGDAYDYDKDGMPNIKDPDMDNDGIPNLFDTDSDGDLTANVFDQDANGNIVNDSTETEGAQFFKEGVEFIAVQVERTIIKAGNVSSTVTISGKLRDEVTPLAVDVRGAPSLFNGATINNITTNAETGEEELIESAWDKRLVDDGLNNDGAPGDRVFARRVVLQAGKTPKSEQVLFLRLAFGETSKPWFLEYPYTFPDVTTKDISVTYDKTLKRVTLVGSPFGSQKSFKWYVDVIGTVDEKEATIVSSDALNGEDTTTWVIPTGTLESGSAYKVRARAQALDKIPSYPAYVITSPTIDITYN